MYTILFDNGSAGFTLHDKEFSSVNEAVHCAVNMNSCRKFTIIKVIEWRAEYYPTQ